ncbi:MAG TPA: class I SAM-dependent methyltransferase [Solirubrobacterales bacterium]|nr:class I SAM-dependent methyltransferase [Solirubrobacterales bacterium]
MEHVRDFEEMYAAAGDDLASVPWANLRPFPLLVEWLDGAGAGVGGTALVIGSGYGDDAEELARRGFAVTGFDLSPTAMARTRERFPDSTVDYRVADLFDLPGEWSEGFDLVVEIRTLQSLPVPERKRGAAAIAATVAPGGRLWLFALGRETHAARETRPWPVTPEELGELEAAGLRWESRREDLLDADLYDVVGTLRRPAS